MTSRCTHHYPTLDIASAARPSELLSTVCARDPFLGHNYSRHKGLGSKLPIYALTMNPDGDIITLNN
jgi:hypothetical protein